MLRNPIIADKDTAAFGSYLLLAALALAMCVLSAHATYKNHNLAISIRADLAKAQAGWQGTPEQRAATADVEKSVWKLEQQSAGQFAFRGSVFLLWIYLARRQFIKNRRERGLCPKCGYNLTANTSGICPECGTPVPNKPEAAA